MTQAQSACPAARPCPISVEVAAHWNDTVLFVRHLDLPCVIWLCEKGGIHSEREIVVPEGALGLGRVPLVVAQSVDDVRVVVLPRSRATIGLRDGGQVVLPVVAGDTEAPTARRAKLEVGMTALVEVGKLTLRVRLTDRLARLPAAPWRPRLGRAGLVATFSLLLHGGLAACSYYAPATANDGVELSEEQRYLIQHYLDGAAETAMEMAEQERAAEEQADSREGGTATRAKGEEGAMGNPNARVSRYGVAGPSDAPDTHVARQAALRDAVEFGVIGLLSSGAGGNPDAPTAPWGRDDSAGNDPSSARGNMWGDGTGTGQGFGSGHGRLALSGVGAGGGGRGASLPANRYGAPSSAAGAPWPTIDEPSAHETPVDPNGRFATTYRPGKGHLAAFDAAMARGVVPTSARELVSDVGARYAPDLAVPDGKALGYSVSLERGALPPSGGPVHLRVALRSSAAQAASKPRLSVHVALDASGSMAGEPLQRAKAAAAHLVDQLAPSDEFSLTVFSTGAAVVVPAGFVGPRRRGIRAAIEQTESAGSTNIGEALHAAYSQAAARSGASDVVPVVMLLSDGQPTAGITDRTRLSFIALQAFQEGIQTSTFGLGTQFDAALMSGIASDGAGGYYYLRSADQIGDAFHAELRQRLEPAAAAVEVRVKLDHDVTLLGVYGSRRLDERESAVERAKEVAADVQAEVRSGIRRDRQDDTKGGMRFFIPAFGRDDAYSLLVKVSVPAGVQPRSLGAFELRYKDLVHRRNVGEESPIHVTFARSDAESVASIDASVARTIQGHMAGDDLLAASRYVTAGRGDAAIALLRERQAILVNAASRLAEPGLRQDAARFTRLLSVLEGDEELGEPMAVAMVLETAARSHLQ